LFSRKFVPEFPLSFLNNQSPFPLSNRLIFHKLHSKRYAIYGQIKKIQHFFYGHIFYFFVDFCLYVIFHFDTIKFFIFCTRFHIFTNSVGVLILNRYQTFFANNFFSNIPVSKLFCFGCHLYFLKARFVVFLQ
jgi:hypothetical protein